MGSEDRSVGQPFTPEHVDVIVHDRANVAAIYGPLLAQVRRGDITTEVIERIEQVSRFAFVRRTGPVGLIAIMEEGATIPSGQVRERQRVAFETLLKSPRSPFVAYVIVGGGVGATLLRSVLRIYLRGMPRVHCADDVESAARWVAAQVERPATDILAFVEYARALARGDVAAP